MKTDSKGKTPQQPRPVIVYVYPIKPDMIRQKDGSVYELIEVAPIGVVVATSPENIGWSLCNKNAGDVFRKDKAKKLAFERAEVNAPLPPIQTAIKRTSLLWAYEEAKETIAYRYQRYAERLAGK